ncbi:MAG: hypothetical protein HRU17_04530 [Polyangiaceae bacterium]|nr:hypothetical protein [Polyangiaceae bacterium]
MTKDAEPIETDPAQLVLGQCSAYVQALFELGAEGATGILDVSSAGQATTIYLRRGVACFAETAVLGDSLGRLMVEQEMIDQDQYRQVVERMTDVVFESEQLRFGEVAVQLGFASHKVVDRALGSQARRRVVRCVEASEVSVSFCEDREAAFAVPNYPCPADIIVLAGVREYFDVARCLSILDAIGGVFPGLTMPQEEFVKKLRLTASESEFTSEIDGFRTVSELVGTDRETQTNLLCALAIGGNLRLSRTPITEAAPQSTDGEGEEESPSSTTTQLSGTEELKSKLAVPRRKAMASRPDARRLAASLARARGVRLPSKTRPKKVMRRPSLHPAPSKPRDENRAKIQAENAFQRGLRYYTRDNFSKALPLFELASQLFPNANEYRVYEGWVALELAQGDEAAAEEKRELLLPKVKAWIKEDRANGFAQYLMGRVLLMKGDNAAAKKAFKVAMNLNPKDRDAERYFRVLSRR